MRRKSKSIKLGLDGRTVAESGLWFRLGRAPKVTKAESYELIKRAQAGDKAAQDKMIEANIRLVVRAAMAYTERPDLLPDLVQAAITGGANPLGGLMRAIQSFDCSRGFSFSTYAIQWIRAAINDELAKQQGPVTVTRGVLGRTARIRRTAARLERRLGRMPTIAEVKAALPPCARKPDWIFEQVLGEAEPHSVTLRALDTSKLSDIPPADAEELTAISGLDGDARVDRLQYALARLDRREREILELRFGIGGTRAPELTYGEIGEELAISRERVRQLHNEALAKLREFMGEPTCET